MGYGQIYKAMKVAVVLALLPKERTQLPRNHEFPVNMILTPFRFFIFVKKIIGLY